MSEKKNYDQITHEHTSFSALDWITGWSKTLGRTFKIKWSNFMAQIQTMIDNSIAGAQLDADLEHDLLTNYALDELATKWDRLWKSKQNDNLGHVPPSDPEVTEDDWWIEQSRAKGAKIPTWEAGVFAETGLVVEQNDYIYKLIVAEGEIPFTSSNLATELAAGKWKQIGKYDHNHDERYYTEAEVDALIAGVTRFKGVFVNLAALEAAYPDAEAGDYANVDGGMGSEVMVYAWDDNDGEWVQQLGESNIETAASVKTKYESNANTNAFTDAAKAITDGIDGISNPAAGQKKVLALDENGAVVAAGITILADGTAQAFDFEATA